MTEKLRANAETRLGAAVDAALGEADAQCERDEEKRYPSLTQIAATVYDANAELMEELKRPILLQRIEWLLKRRRAARFARDWRQDEIPGLLLPKTIILRDGSRPPLGRCTARTLAQGITVLKRQARERATPKIQRLEAALDIMKPYAQKNPSISWAEVVRLELERRDFDRLVS